MKGNNKLIYLLMMTVTLISCGGGGGDAPQVPAVVEKNVAVATNGSTVSSNYAGNESFTTDGDTTTTNFWVGGASNDAIKITFDKLYDVSEFLIYTNNTSFTLTNGGATTTNGIRVLFSKDDISYSEIGVGIGANKDIACFSSSIGSGKISCTFASKLNYRYVKVLVTADFATTNIYEVEVTGS